MYFTGQPNGDKNFKELYYLLLLVWRWNLVQKLLEGLSIHLFTISYLISSVGRGGGGWVISLLRRNKTGRERKDWSCAISGCSWGIYQRDPFRWRYSPGCTPGDRFQQTFSEIAHHSTPSFFFLLNFLFPSILCPLWFDHANWNWHCNADPGVDPRVYLPGWQIAG